MPLFVCVWVWIYLVSSESSSLCCLRSMSPVPVCIYRLLVPVLVLVLCSAASMYDTGWDFLRHFATSVVLTFDISLEGSHISPLFSHRTFFPSPIFWNLQQDSFTFSEDFSQVETPASRRVRVASHLFSSKKDVVIDDVCTRVCTRVYTRLFRVMPLFNNLQRAAQLAF